jgi:hypothetical protein
MKFVWIPEAPDFPGTYANDKGTDIKSGSKISTGEKQPSTFVAADAKHFATQEECQAWCDDNPVPKFRPAEHGFEGE